MSEYIEVGQPLQFTDPNTPTRVGEIVENVSDIYNIPSPHLGMQVFVKSEKKSFVITSLKSKVVNGVDVPEAAVEAFEAVGAKSITWNNDTDPSNMNDFVVAGVYDIKGEHTREDDNLPILNTGGGHSFNARLTVLDSSISGSGNSDDKCITQVLSFSNRLGRGEVYIRTGKGSSLYNLTWENWSTLQRNVNVGEVGSLDDLKDNGIYSGVWKQGRINPNYLAFVCIVINDYFIGIAPRRVSQFVYGLSKSDGSVVYQSRVWDDSKGMWGNWEILNQKEIASMISAEIKKVTDGVDPNKIDSLKDIITWIEEHGDVAGILAAIEGLYDELGREIDARMSVDNDTRGKGVLFGGFSNRQTTADEVVIGYKNIAQNAEGAFAIPAATTVTAGVMSAEDKEKLDTLVINDLTTGGADKALSAEMGKELSAELTKLDEEINKIGDSRQVTYIYGALNTDTGKPVAAPTGTPRIYSSQISSLCAIQCNGAVKMRIFRYDVEGNFINESGEWVTTCELTDAGYLYRLLFKADDNILTLDTMKEYVNITYSDGWNVAFNKKLSELEQMSGITYRLETSANIHNSLPATTSDEEPNDGSDWYGHSFNTIGAVSANTRYTLTDYISVEGGASYRCMPSLRRLVWFTADKMKVGSAIESATYETELIAPTNAAYARFMYDNGNNTVSPADVKFGRFDADIDVDYVNEYHDYDTKGRRILLEKDLKDIDNRVENIQRFLQKKALKVLFIGSSLGVNTIIQVPFLGEIMGIEMTCGNMYAGSATLELWATKCKDDTLMNSAIYYPNSKVWTTKSMSITQMLTTEEWDIVVLQRGAEEAHTWTTEQSNALDVIIEHIRSVIPNHPKIMFNSTFARGIAYFDSRQSQINYTKNVMVSAKKMQNEFGLDVVPTALAIQNARNTELSLLGYYDGGNAKIPDLCYDRTHLDIGVGSYVVGAAFLEYIISKMYNISVLTNSSMPTATELATRGIWTASAYTSPTDIERYFRIANACAALSVSQPWSLSKELAVRFSSPNEIPEGWDYTIDYTQLYDDGITDTGPDIDPL